MKKRILISIIFFAAVATITLIVWLIVSRLKSNVQDQPFAAFSYVEISIYEDYVPQNGDYLSLLHDTSAPFFEYKEELFLGNFYDYFIRSTGFRGWYQKDIFPEFFKVHLAEWTPGLIGECEVANVICHDANDPDITLNVLCLYDFATQKPYIITEGMLFSSGECWDLIGETTNFSEAYRHLFIDERYPEGDKARHGFRYLTFFSNPYEKDTAIFSGFVNKDVSTVSTPADAIALAEKEVEWPNMESIAFYDTTTGYWLVGVYKKNPRNPARDEGSIYETASIVIMNEKGQTIEMVDKQWMSEGKIRVHD